MTSFFRKIPTYRLFTRFTSALTLVLLASATLTFVILEYFNTQRDYQALLAKGHNLIDYQSRILAQPMWDVDYEAVQLIAKSIGDDADVAAVRVNDENGAMVADTGDWLRHSDKQFHLNRNIVFLTDSDEERIGDITLLLDKVRVTNALEEAAAFYAAMIIVTLLLWIMVFLALYHMGIGKPLNRLVTSIQHFHEQGETLPVEWHSKDEMGDVVTAYNDMLSARSRQEQNIVEKNRALKWEAEVKQNSSELTRQLMRVVNQGDLDDILDLVLTNVKQLTNSHCGAIRIDSQTLTGIGGGVYVSGDLSTLDCTQFQQQLEHATASESSVEDTMEESDQLTVPILTEGQSLGLMSIKRDTPFAMRDRQAVGQIANILTASLIQYNERLLRQQLEQSLRQSQKLEAIGTLAGGIAHDFNNILAGILGFAELGKIKAAKNEPLEPYFDHIIKSSGRAADLVRQMLTFSRSSEAEQITVNMCAVVQESVKLLRATIPSSIDIHLECPPDELMIRTDPVQIQRIVMNICTNAYQALPDQKGRIAIDLALCPIEQAPEKTDAAEYIRLSISDNGTGIAADRLERIFEPFYTTKGIGNGTGLGLSVVHGLVQSMGGHIDVESTTELGTTVTVYLPRNMDQLVAEAATLDATLPSGSGLILIADDEEAIRNVTRSALTQHGYQVIEAADGAEAMELYRNNMSDLCLILTDQTMPKMSGMELAKKVRETNSEIPIILASGYSEQINDETLEKNDIELLMKPIPITTLMTKIHQQLAIQNQTR